MYHICELKVLPEACKRLEVHITSAPYAMGCQSG